jgi:LPXTG-motif cell wall-anchored protein
MANPMAVLVIGLGVVLCLAGLFLLGRRRKLVSVVISVLGLAAIAAPFLISLFLGMPGP